MRCHVAPVDFMEDDNEEEEKTYDACMALAGCSLRHRPRRVQEEGPDQSDI